MKKQLALILSALMVFSGCITAFAAGEKEMAMKDVAGTKYEAAVTDLAAKKIISGYEDQTFKPAAAITRAEACVVVVKAMNPSQVALDGAKDSGFTDVASVAKWAGASINYAVEKGIVKGYGNGIFKPAGNVTYNEMAAMLVNAAGVKSTELKGTWPQNYMTKATEMGMFRAIIAADKAFDSNVAANRGDVALMTFAVADKIATAHKPATETTTGGAVDKTTTGAVDKTTGTAVDKTTGTAVDKTTGTAVDKTTGAGVSSTGKLADYTGTATGMINEVVKVVNKAGESVNHIEFLMGTDTMQLLTDGKVNVNNLSYDGSVYTLKMKNGVVTGVSTNGDGVKGYRAITGSDWETVVSRDDKIVTIKGTPNTKLTVMNNAVIYEAKMVNGAVDSYRATTLSSVAKDSQIRAYDVTDDKADNADIVVVMGK